MRMLVVNIMKWIAMIGILVCAVFLIWYCAISTGKIEPYREENGSILSGSIAEKTIIEVNGAKNGLIIRGKSLENPVLLFVSSGPGTSDYFLNEEYPDMNLEDYFTVCYWDYRGMCLVYDKDIDPQTITTEQLQEDTLAITTYLKERFDKEKIYIMGFSGGTHTALQAAKRYPENYFAYFGMAQVVTKGEETDTLMYDFMKEVFTKRKDYKRLKQLENSVTFTENGNVVCKNWFDYVFLLHEAGGGTIKDKSELTGIVIPIIKSHCYTAKEKIDYICAMKMYRTTPFYAECEARNYYEEIRELQIPAYFISGEYDYNSPWPLVEQYCDVLEAPKKYFLLVPDAAHSPLWENPKIVIDFMVDTINS